MTPRELAAAIRKGAMLVVENNMTHCGCALGTAFWGVYGHSVLRENPPLRDMKWLHFLADKLGLEFSFADEIEKKHLSGISRLAIADWLDTLEPETKPADQPADKQSFDAFMATVMKPVPVTA